MLDLVYRSFIRRWSLDDNGYPQCVEDAISTSSPLALQTLQRSSAIANAIARVEAYEADNSIEASDATKAFALWRSPKSEDVNEWNAARAVVEKDIDEDAAAPLVDDPRPLPTSVSVRQFAQACANMGLISDDEALNWAKHKALPAVMEAMLAVIPTQYQFYARMLVEGAATFEPGNDFVTMFALVIQPPMDDDDLAKLWRDAAALA